GFIVGGPVGDFELLLCHGTVCVVGKIRDLILQLSKSSIYSTKPTNTTLLSEKVVIYYEKRGNAENYIKEAKYDMAVGHLLLKSFWANEAVFQMMMLSYNLFLLFKFDSLDSSEYRQQIKTFRLKYVFLAAKIIKTARYVIMKLSENYPYKGVYEKCLV
ncbi:transposase, partial [Klebsiella pneumoniae]|uniref:transposase n=8 Tax=Gammaproteobacteria TaxID=1236 RepID=UPI001D189813